MPHLVIQCLPKTSKRNGNSNEITIEEEYTQDYCRHINFIKCYICFSDSLCKSAGGYILDKYVEGNEQYDFHSNLQYQERMSEFEKQKVADTDIIFLGDSLTYKFKVEDYFQDKSILNRGIGSDVSEGVLSRIDEVLSHNPQKCFLMIGINDIAKGIDKHDTIYNVLMICSELKRNNCTVYVESVLPSGEGFDKEIVEMNKDLKLICEMTGIEYIDLYSKFIKQGAYNEEYYVEDMVHLNDKGYELWAECIYGYLQ